MFDAFPLFMFSSLPAGAGPNMHQPKDEEELHRHPGLSTEHHQRLLENGLPGELPRDRYDNQGGGAGQGAASLFGVVLNTF